MNLWKLFGLARVWADLYAFPLATVHSPFVIPFAKLVRSFALNSSRIGIGCILQIDMLYIYEMVTRKGITIMARATRPAFTYWSARSWTTLHWLEVRPSQPNATAWWHHTYRESHAGPGQLPRWGMLFFSHMRGHNSPSAYHQLSPEDFWRTALAE